VAGEPYVTIFNGKVRLPEDYFAKNNPPQFEIKFGRGHPMQNHPVENVRDPDDPNKVKTEINCLTCHQAHAGDARAMLVNEQRPGAAFCRTCHKGMIEGEKQ
jgi:predicted CXXCH cytochrome family protein